MGKQNVVYKGILIRKKEEVLICATTWINIKNIMLHERSKSKKKDYILYNSIDINCLEEANV